MVEIEAHPREDTESLREAFRKYESGVALANARRAAVFAGLFMLVGWALDWIVFPERAWDFLLIRTLSATLLGLVFLQLGRLKKPTMVNRVAQSIALLPLISICVMIAMTDGGNSVYYAGLNLVLVGLSLLLRWTFWNSLGMITSCAVCYAVSVAASPVVPNLRLLFNNSCSRCH